MAPTLAVTWNDKKGHVRATLTALALVVAILSTPAGQQVRTASAETVSVIVREMPRAGDVPERLVATLGGTVESHISIIDGFTALVPESSMSDLTGSPAILSVTPDARIQLTSVDGHDVAADPNSMYNIGQTEAGAGSYWADGYTGRGVGVALIDSGVLPVEGLTTPGKVVNGPDLSFESQVPQLEHLDTFGHGTHMAGIIAGRDDDTPEPVQKGDQDHFLGMAPGAHIVNIKVADALGAADVSQVIAAIDWVVTHRNDPGMNIRVLNLSFGTDGVQDYLLDPLTFAAEAAWQKGIVVVVAGGNKGYGSTKLNNPAYDPYVIAVGAATTNAKYSADGDTVADFSSRGDALRRPDFVAPGTSVASLRAPGSFIDETNPQARVAGRFFRGSGTSQAAAVVSGAAALIIQQRPEISPDQVKALMVKSAKRIFGATAAEQGAGMIDLRHARDMVTPTKLSVTQMWPRATGLGSLELARGTAHASDGQVTLEGEQDIFGTPWRPSVWTALAAGGTAWSGGDWLGKTWSGGCWCASSWSGTSWEGKTWSGTAWSGKTWSGDTWTGKTWSGKTWSGDGWEGKTWSGKTWSGKTWSGDGWPAADGA
jgi:subtilisin family serine protease